MREYRLKSYRSQDRNSRKKGQWVAAELLCDISQTYVDPDQQERDAILVKSKRLQTVKIVEKNSRKDIIRYWNPRGIRMIFIVSKLVHLVNILKPQISHLEIRRQHQRWMFTKQEFPEYENYNTVMDISVTVVLIDILRFHSASSSLSIHLST